MTGNARQTPQERVCGPIVAGHEQDTTSDGTGPQNGPEGTVGMDSIDRLRELADQLDAVSAMQSEHGFSPIAMKLRRMADAIEREVEERYVALPLDADDEPIKVGYLMDGYGTTIEVTELQYGACGWNVIDENGRCIMDSFALRRHEPTVEDVLKDFIDAWAEWKDGAAMMNPVETFAAKLRLAGDE